jgi:hypothetical protein
MSTWSDWLSELHMRWYRWPSIGVEGVFEYDPLIITFTDPLGLGAVLTCWSLLPTFDASSAAGYDAKD